MASILRGFRYPFGYVATVARSLTFNGSRPIDGTAFMKPATQCSCNYSMNAFATASRTDTIDRSLNRLNTDAKRMGRISRRDIEDALEEIKSHRSATSSQSLSVIRCCGNLVPEELPEVRTALVLEIWNTLNKLNVPMDISHYNALLRVYLENEHDFSPSEFLADLESKGVEPNRVTYQRLIAHYCQKGDIEGATKILEFMKEKQLPVNENVFNALIMGHSQAGDMESAMGILNVMKQAGLAPSSDTYATLLCGYAKEGNFEAIENTLNTCEKSEVFLLDRDILEIIYNLAINGHAAHIDSLISRIRKSAGYNQDAVNVILRLVNKGQEDVGLKILLTMARGFRQDGELSDTGTFMVRQMVRSGRPAESIIKICQYLEENGLNPRALLVAVEKAATSNSTATRELLQAIHAVGHPIRQHYFWPLICSAKNQDEVLNAIKIMRDEFNINVGYETLCDYVIPRLREKNHEAAIGILRSAGATTNNAVRAVVSHALAKQQLSEAAQIVSAYQLYYSPMLYKRPLMTALSRTKDLDSFILFVRHMLANLERRQPALRNEVTEEAEVDEESASAAGTQEAIVLGNIVYEAFLYFKRDGASMFLQILNELVKQGLTISSHHATLIQEKLGADLTPEISELLGKLSTGDLEPTPLERAERPRRTLNEMDSATLEKLIATFEAKGDSANNVKRQLLATYIREKNVEKLEKAIEQLQVEGFVITNGVFAQVADLYASQNELEKALGVVEKIRAQDPDFRLDNTKVIRIAQLFVDRDQHDDCLKFLEANKQNEFVETNRFDYNTACWRLLNSVAEKGQPQQLQKLFDAMVEYKYCEPNNVVLGPLIKVHLVKDDITAAMKVFEESVQKYRATPWKNELTCRLIQKEDPENLQKLTDLSASVHGEINSLYDLVLSFVECGRIRQARKILETPGLRTRSQKINRACERYRQEGLVEPLEGLVEVTRDLNHVDRIEIYYQLLLSYIKDNKPEKALGLWTNLQEEDVPPSDKFLTKLGNFLQQNNLKVPFVMPQNVEEDVPVSEIPRTKQRVNTTNTSRNPKGQSFQNALATGNIEAAINARQNMTNPSPMQDSQLIEALTKADRLSEAKKIVMDLLNRDIVPTRRIFQFFISRCASAGNVEDLVEISRKIYSETKKLHSFDNRLCHAYIVSGRVEEYLTKLETDIERANTPEEIQAVGENFPRGGINGIITQQPELLDRIAKLAEKYAAKNVNTPMNMVWAHYFVANNDAKADEIYTKYLTNESRLMFQLITRTARDTQNTELAQKLVKKLTEAKISEGALGIAYSCYIDVLATQEKFTEAVKVIEQGVKSAGLETLNRSTMLRVKEGVEKAGQKFPFPIPERTKRSKAVEDTSSSSSSSSDDEVTQVSRKE